MTKISLLAFLSAFVFSGCIRRQAFYVSPFNAHHSSYHTIPLKSDSIRSAYYVNGAISFGSANRGARDNTFSLQSNIAGSHNFGSFQAYYSGNLSVGNYNVRKYDSVFNSYTVNYRVINNSAGNKTFYGTGFDAGMNLVLPLGGGSEWRIIGMQTSLQKEYGAYMNFRKQLPDSAATLVVGNDLFATLGGYTEIITQVDNSSIGIKLAMGKVLGNEYRKSNIYDNVSRQKLEFNYFNFTLNYTYDKWTGFLQTTFATKASAMMLGLNYRITKSKEQTVVKSSFVQ